MDEPAAQLEQQIAAIDRKIAEIEGKILHWGVLAFVGAAVVVGNFFGTVGVFNTSFETFALIATVIGCFNVYSIKKESSKLSSLRRDKWKALQTCKVLEKRSM